MNESAALNCCSEQLERHNRRLETSFDPNRKRSESGHEASVGAGAKREWAEGRDIFLEVPAKRYATFSKCVFIRSVGPAHDGNPEREGETVYA